MSMSRQRQVIESKTRTCLKVYVVNIRATTSTYLYLKWGMYVFCFVCKGTSRCRGGCIFFGSLDLMGPETKGWPSLVFRLEAIPSR